MFDKLDLWLWFLKPPKIEIEKSLKVLEFHYALSVRTLVRGHQMQALLKSDQDH